MYIHYIRSQWFCGAITMHLAEVHNTGMGAVWHTYMYTDAEQCSTLRHRCRAHQRQYGTHSTSVKQCGALQCSLVQHDLAQVSLPHAEQCGAPQHRCGAVRYTHHSTGRSRRLGSSVPQCFKVCHTAPHLCVFCTCAGVQHTLPAPYSSVPALHCSEVHLSALHLH